MAVLDGDEARIGITWAAHYRTADVTVVYDCVITHRSDLSLVAATLRDRGLWIPVLMDAEAPQARLARGSKLSLGQSTELMGFRDVWDVEKHYS